jgi:putative membrane protein
MAMMWGVYDGMGWWMLFGGILMLLFWGAIIFLVVWGIRSLTGRGQTPPEVEDPLKIAQLRYARGEITGEQFEAIRATLAGEQRERILENGAERRAKMHH